MSSVYNRLKVAVCPVCPWHVCARQCVVPLRVAVLRPLPFDEGFLPLSLSLPYRVCSVLPKEQPTRN